MPLLVGQTVSHYAIQERLGEGGMGIVYRALDLRLNRPVALKFLVPETTRDPHAKQRLIHEARAASALQHNNVCTVHDIDETGDGQLFIVMDLYEGETLQERIGRAHLSAQEISDVAVQIVRGMIAAHGCGIIHRDLKPSNIFLTRGGVVKIFDFGLAKMVTAQAITREGITVGTVPYMSPEQLRGEKVDHRTDIWSFGVALYRMLTGRLPFAGDVEQAVAYRILNEEPEPITAEGAELRVRLKTVAERCLQKDPSARPRDMAEVLAMLGDRPAEHVLRSKTLRAIAVGGAACALFGLSIYVGVTRFMPAKARQGSPRLAVLLFANQTGDHDFEAFRPGIQNDFVSTLAAAGGLEIEDGQRINDLIREHFGTDNPPRTDALYDFLRAREYDYALEGSVTRSPQGGYSLQVTCKDTRAFGAVLETFDKASLSKERLMSGSGELADEVLAYLHIRILNAKPEMGVWETGRRYENWAAVAQLDRAYEATLRGDARGATASLRKAIELDPEFISPRIWITPALAANEKESAANLEVLRRLRPTADEFGQTMIDWVEAYREGASGRQVGCLTRALKHDPGNRILLANLADAYAVWGDTASSISEYQQLARSRWKFPAIYQSGLKYVFRRGDHAAAGEILAIWRSVDTSENSSMLFGWLTALAVARGDSLEAARCRTRFDSLSVVRGSDRDAALFALGRCFADVGLLERGEEYLREAIAGNPERPAYHDRLGDVRVARRDTAAGLAEYSEAVRLGSTSHFLHLKLGDLTSAKGDLAGARDHYRKFIQNDSTSGEARRVRQWLSRSLPRR